MNLRVLQKTDAQPIAGAEVRVFRSEFPEAQQQTDAQGQCPIMLGEPPPDYLAIFVRKMGFVPLRAIWDLSKTPGLPTDFTLTLDPAIRIGGRILDESAHPVEGVTVHLILRESGQPGRGIVSSDLFDKTATTDADGRWQFDEAPSDFADVMFRLAHPDYVEALHFAKAGIPREHFLREEAVWPMSRGVRVEGTVVDAAGQPIPDAEILPGEDRVCSGAKPTFRTDAAGKFSLPLAPGQRVSLTVKAEGHSPALLQFTAAHDLPRLRIALPPARVLRGRVVDADGMPVSGVHVFADTWRRHRTLEWSTRTDADGKFAWLSAPAEEVQFDFLKKGFRAARRLPLTASNTELTIVLRRPLCVRGTVQDAATGKAISAFRVIPGSVLQRGQIHWARNQAVASTTGAYEWSTEDTFAPDAALHLRIEAEGYTSAVQTIPDTGDAVTLDFTLHPGPSLEGLVLAPDGTPVADATVVIALGQPAFLEGAQLREGHGNITVQTSPDGTFRLPSQEPPYAMIVAHPLGYGLAIAEKSGESSRIQLQPWGRLEIATAADPSADGKIPFYLHYVDSPQQPPKFISIQPIPARTADRRIVFEHLPPGKAHLGRFHRANDEAMPLVIAAGQTTSLDFDRRSHADGRRLPGTVAVQVVDESGAPIEGATVVINGFRLGERAAGFSMYPSMAGNSDLRTDRQGVITLGYPPTVGQPNDVTAVYLHVRHPDFCPTYTDCPVEGEALPIVLRRGIVVRATGWADSGCAPDCVYAQLIPQNRRDAVPASEWAVENGTVLVNHHVPPGKFLLRLICLPAEGGAAFSEVVEGEAEAGAPLEFPLPLQSGVRFSGTLDSAVPRPVLHGHVVAHVTILQEKATRAWEWRAETTVQADGSFVLETLPPGDVELIAYCDGFISKNSPTRPASQVRTPQNFPATRAVVAMEPAATVRVRVIDRAGLPIPGARLTFQPNVQWADRSCGLFTALGFCTADTLRLSPAELQKRRQEPRALSRFQGTTDEHGTCTIADLPPGPQMYHIAAAGFEVEQSENFEIPGLLEAHLAPGRLQNLTITLAKLSQR